MNQHQNQKKPSKMPHGIEICDLSDVHFGANKVSPIATAENIKKYVFSKITKSLDIFILPGDYFEHALDLDSDASFYAIQIILELIDLSIKYDFIIRILQGTFLHDRKQNKFFNLINKDIKNKHGVSRVKIISTIDVEILDYLNISIAYKPDDLPFKNSYEILKNKINNCNIDKVDILVNHGYFEHLLPRGIPHTPSNTLSYNLTKKIVKGFVINGHIHTPGVYENIISTGSFERLQHNEEENKGFYFIHYKINKPIEYEFIINKSAAIFISIDISKYNTDEVACAKYVHKRINKIINNSQSNHDKINIRIVGDDSNMRIAMVSYIVKTFKNIRATHKSKSKAKDTSYDALKNDNIDLEDLPVITENNVVETIMLFLKEKNISINKSYVQQTLNVKV